jgi:ribosomal protein S18 acetylase RimI-like enzyme
VNTNIEIRQAQLDDAEVIYQLSIQLGYSPTPASVRSSLEILLKHRDYEVVVITEISDDLKVQKVVGWITLQLRYRIEDKAFLQVAALVTDESCRGKGYGKKLMNYAEEQARKKELTMVALHSSKSRLKAHGFYEKLGYERKKESFFFIKEVV